MVKIEWEIDKNFDAKIDPDDLLGSIKITGDRGIINDNCTYLDVWFDALIYGFYHVKIGKSTEYDLMSEPNNLIFEAKKQGFVIKYGDSKIVIDSVGEFYSELLKSTQRFREELGDAVEVIHKVLFKEIDSFLNAMSPPSASTTDSANRNRPKTPTM